MLETDVSTLMMERSNPIAEDQRSLWCAVIHQAVEDLRGCHDQTDKKSIHRKRLWVEKALAWFASEDTCPNSFLFLCELLDLDPAGIRNKLLAEENDCTRINSGPETKENVMPENCKVEGCNSRPAARGLCSIHYDAWRHGNKKVVMAMGGPFSLVRVTVNKKKSIAPGSEVIPKVMAKAAASRQLTREPSDENDRPKLLADAHWRYVHNLLVAHGYNGDLELLSCIEFHYKSAMIHGYKHGQTDATVSSVVSPLES